MGKKKKHLKLGNKLNIYIWWLGSLGLHLHWRLLFLLIILNFKLQEIEKLKTNSKLNNNFKARIKKSPK